METEGPRPEEDVPGDVPEETPEEPDLGLPEGVLAEGATRYIKIQHRLGCPRCHVPMTVWLQKTVEGASPKLLIPCEKCWRGFQVTAKKTSHVQFEPFYLTE